MRTIGFALLLSATLSLPAIAQSGGAETDGFEIDFSLSGAWYNPDTPGQGWMLDVSPTDNLFFAAWFTWQGDGGHDWYTVQGNYAGNTATVPLLRTSGGRFNDPSPTELEIVGEAEFRFQNCNQAELRFRFDELAEPEVVSLHRITAAPHACREPAPKVAFRFGTRARPDGSEDFVATTRDPDLIAQLRAQLDVPEDERSGFVLGTIARGGGGHNLDWNWHFVANAWRTVEAAVEVCDGRSSEVDEDLDYWVDHLGYFCPWSSYVQAEITGDVSD